MAYTRGLKPDFFKDEDLACLPFEARLFFAGLWCCADKEGRLEDRPKYLKIEVFPYDNVDIEKMLELLAHPRLPGRPGKIFIRRYEVDGRKYLDIPEFSKHQIPHPSEKGSNIPDIHGVVAKPDAEERKPKAGAKKPQGVSDEDFIQVLKLNPAYQGVDIDRELARMDAWFMTPSGKGRQKTRRFILNWLNKVERPMKTDSKQNKVVF